MREVSETGDDSILAYRVIVIRIFTVIVRS